MVKRKHKHSHIMQQPRKRKEPETEKEILDAILDLETRRINLGHYPSIRRMAYEDAITSAINKLRVKLEVKKCSKT